VKSGKDWGSINEQMAQRGYEPEQIPVNRSREWSKQETLAGMVLIQAGEFTRPGRYYLGEDAQPVEGDSYKVSVSSFYMDKYEVTEEDYCKFLNDGNEGYCTPWYQGIKRDNQGRFVPADPTQSRLPVGGVNYHQARGYAEWAGKRLPTEAEWEYAAGGKESRKFPWGNEAPDETRANYGGKFGVKPVGSFPKGQTPEGVCDLAGSVSEWCADYYSYSDEYYRKAPPGGLAKDPQGPDRGYTRMFKGGCFGTATPLALSVFRRHDRPPLNASRCLGFRCVRSAAP
jgi:formylglycine-generating enzyme required for sulfatase activity